jgi:serine/threonine protein phosphatase 1
MLERLFRPHRSPPARPRVDARTRVYAVGDIHGRADLLGALHARILDDARSHAADRRVVVYLGDYVDRGLDSKGVVDLILADPLPGFEKRCLKGNHEDLMLSFLDDPEVGPSWFHNGGIATLVSYGVKARATGSEGPSLVEVQQAFRERLSGAHLDFFRGLALHHREGDYLFVHAGIRPGVALEEQSEQDLIWIREPFLYSRADHGYVVVHGHSINEQVVEAPNRIGIDTGAYFSGKLTCLALQGETRTFLHT